MGASTICLTKEKRRVVLSDKNKDFSSKKQFRFLRLKMSLARVMRFGQALYAVSLK
jgi:hypothetical protein